MKSLLSYLICAAIISISGCTNSDQSDVTPKTDIASQAVALDVSASTLCSDYQNVITGDNKYKDKIISVTGTVTMVDKVFGQPVINLDGGSTTADCTFDNNQESKLGKIKVGQTITVKGHCTGESLGSPQLEDCLLQ